MDPVEEGLLFAIRESPDDDQPRLVYADWLSARDPLRAELIAVACAAARDGVEDAVVERLTELLSQPELAWWKDAVRGFWAEDAYRVTADDFLRDPDHHFRVAPLARTLVLVNAHGRMRELVGQPALARYRSLHLNTTRRRVDGVAYTDEDHELLAACPHLAGLADLELNHRELGDRGLAAIVRSPVLALRRLSIADNRGLTRDGLAELLAPSAPMANVVELDLSGLTGVGPALAHVLERAWRATLRRLVVRRCRLDELRDGAALALAGRPLEHVDLSSNNLAWRHVAPLAALRRTLASLRLSHNVFGDVGVDNLIAADFERLARLEVAACGITEASARRLFARVPRSLVAVDLSTNRLGASLDVLALDPGAHRFAVMSLDNGDLDEASAIRFVSSPAVDGLREVDFARNGLGEHFVDALVRSPHLRALRVLNMRSLRQHDELARRLGARFGAVVVFDAPQ